ncbi:hypothetical protein L1049_010386 [Liquidambar formosana]|uniref:Uncharacterized protein n=1 Tax=Liquidambar formosana TaxID=63359 RepID=A0AAP0NBE2_LIQFO
MGTTHTLVYRHKESERVNGWALHSSPALQRNRNYIKDLIFQLVGVGSVGGAGGVYVCAMESMYVWGSNAEKEGFNGVGSENFPDKVMLSNNMSTYKGQNGRTVEGEGGGRVKKSLWVGSEGSNARNLSARRGVRKLKGLESGVKYERNSERSETRGELCLSED